MSTPEEMLDSLKTLGNLVNVEMVFDGGEEMHETVAELKSIYGENEIRKVRQITVQYRTAVRTVRVFMAGFPCVYPCVHICTPSNTRSVV